MIADLESKLAAFEGIEPDKTQPPLWNGEPDQVERIPGIRFLGNMPYVRSSRDLASSPLGIGFETLDRDTFDPSELYPVLAASGVKHARCQTGWMKCEKTVGQYDFSWLDDIADHLLAGGIAPWFSLSFGHPVHTPSPKYEAMREEAEKTGTRLPGAPRGYVGETPYLHGEEAMEAWKRYVAAICEHFKGRIGMWEVWNEPEGKTFWKCRGEGSPQCVDGMAAEYTDFVRQTAEVVRAVDPKARVGGVCSVAGTDYCAGLGKAGLGNYIDFMSFHAYASVPELYLPQRLGQLRAILKRTDGRTVELIQGESGRATGRSALMSFPTQLGQARFIARRYLYDFMNGLSMSSYFTASDLLCYYGDGRNQYFGIYDQERKAPKLGFETIRSMSWLFDGLELAPEFLAMLTPPRGLVGSWLPYQAVTGAFRRKGVPLFAVWVPEHVDLSLPPMFGELDCVTQDKSLLPEPVILDPVRRKVWDARGAVNKDGSKRGQCCSDVFPMFPVGNSPLIVTDAAVFEEL